MPVDFKKLKADESKFNPSGVALINPPVVTPEERDAAIAATGEAFLGDTNLDNETQNAIAQAKVDTAPIAEEATKSLETDQGSLDALLQRVKDAGITRGEDNGMSTASGASFKTASEDAIAPAEGQIGKMADAGDVGAKIKKALQFLAYDPTRSSGDRMTDVVNMLSTIGSSFGAAGKEAWTGQPSTPYFKQVLEQKVKAAEEAAKTEAEKVGQVAVAPTEARANLANNFSLYGAMSASKAASYFPEMASEATKAGIDLQKKATDLMALAAREMNVKLTAAQALGLMDFEFVMDKLPASVAAAINQAKNEKKWETVNQILVGYGNLSPERAKIMTQAMMTAINAIIDPATYADQATKAIRSKP